MQEEGGDAKGNGGGQDRAIHDVVPRTYLGSLLTLRNAMPSHDTHQKPQKLAIGICNVVKEVSRTLPSLNLVSRRVCITGPQIIILLCWSTQHDRRYETGY